MKILVCISVVPDTTTKITFTDNNTKFNQAGVQFILNPYDELALTRALEICETRNDGSTVTVAHVGLADAEPVIRKALSIGANDAVRINVAPADSRQVATLLAETIKNGGYDLVLCGRESIDYNSGAVCSLLGQELQWPAVNVMNHLEINGTTATIEHDIDGGREQLNVDLPFVGSAQKDLCEPRIPNMKGIMAARTKPLQVIEPGSSPTAAQYTAFELPPAKQSVKLIDAENAAELIHMLRNEAKVI